MAEVNPMHRDALAQIKWYQEQNKKDREKKKAEAKEEAKKIAKESGSTVNAAKAVERKEDTTKNAPSEHADAVPGSTTAVEGAKSITPGGTK